MNYLKGVDVITSSAWPLLVFYKRAQVRRNQLVFCCMSIMFFVCLCFLAVWTVAVGPGEHKCFSAFRRLMKDKRCGVFSRTFSPCVWLGRTPDQLTMLFNAFPTFGLQQVDASKSIRDFATLGPRNCNSMLHTVASFVEIFQPDACYCIVSCQFNHIISCFMILQYIMLFSFVYPGFILRLTWLMWHCYKGTWH